MSDVLIAGCGLIGTSVGMALTEAGLDVCLHDEVPAVVGEAVRRGAGRPWDGAEATTTAVVAVPPRLTAAVLLQLQQLNVARTYTHVCSVQSQVQREVEALSKDVSAIVGGHPLAGREQSGPRAATSDLFVGRPWALCPGGSSDTAQEDVRRIVETCGADAVWLPAGAHDASVALLSHAPQVLASALAAALAPAGGGSSNTDGGASGTAALRLAGPGLVDTTRLAASDPELWAQILELNAAEVAPVIAALAQRLTTVAGALAALAEESSPQVAAGAVAQLRALLRDGNAGRALVPVKRGAREEAFAPLRVSVRDEPGRLAALLRDAGAADVNVEDVHVEHLPGRPTGVIELLVHRTDVAALASSLQRQGWSVLVPDA